MGTHRAYLGHITAQVRSLKGKHAQVLREATLSDGPHPLFLKDLPVVVSCEHSLQTGALLFGSPQHFVWFCRVYRHCLTVAIYHPTAAKWQANKCQRRPSLPDPDQQEESKDQK